MCAREGEESEGVFGLGARAHLRHCASSLTLGGIWSSDRVANLGSFLWNSIGRAYLNACLKKAANFLSSKFYPNRSISYRDAAKSINSEE